MATELDQLDLNLLVVFEALLEERSVTRAAAKVARSQPAVSSALQRLRATLGDPLFVRGRYGMTPTPRALQLEGPIRQAMTTLRGVLEPSVGFDPSTARKTFVVAASDHAQLLVMPGLAREWSRWPGVRVQCVALPALFPSAALEHGELDLVLGAFDLARGDEAPRGLKRQLLIEERWFVVGRAGHPALRRPTLERLARWPQVNVSPRGGTSNRFEARRTLAIERNIVLFVPHYLSVPWVLSSSDLLAVVPERIALAFEGRFGLEMLPVERAPAMKVQQLWHPRSQGVEAHQWLRGEVFRAARGHVAR